MERSYLEADALVELDFTADNKMDFHSHENIELLFVVSGEMQMTLEEDRYRLKDGDIVLINTNRKHRYQGTKNLLLARFLISYAKVRELLGMDYVLFWCNSAVDQNEAYDVLRRIIFKILNQTIRDDGCNKLFFSSMYYRILYVLSENFILNPKDERYKSDDGVDNDRMQRILAYIRNNYRQNISLNEIAEHLFLSPTYVSRYISQKYGKSFIQLINSVRLSHAIEELMYYDDSIVKIAMENGFASVAAYNKAFKEAYRETPTEFRKAHRSEKEAEEGRKLKKHALVRQKIQELLNRNPNDVDEKDTVCSVNIDADMTIQPEHCWDHNSLRMINVGTAVELLNAVVQKQILDNRESLLFEYVRFWDIYDPDLYLDLHSTDGNQNYSRINMITDFLVKNNLKPYIDLGFKSKRILRTTAKIVCNKRRDDFFKDETEMKSFYNGLFQNFIKRYGSWEVRGWYFEYWEKPINDDSHSETFQYLKISEEQHKEYFRQFNVIARSLRSLLPESRIGGAGFPVRVYGREFFARILTQWEKSEQQPDFITLSSYPYQQEKEGGVYYEKRSSDLNFVRYDIENAEKAMKLADFPEVPIHVTEYNLCLSSRNILNDSCLKAAYLMNNTIDCLGKAEILGHYLFSDFFTEAEDTGSLIYGGNGFLTKDGIAKPAFFAMEYLHMLYPAVLKKDKNYMITRNSRGSIRLVCHNLKTPNFIYYQAEEDALKIQELQSILSDREFLNIKLKVNGMHNGVYVIKTSVLNSHHGSIQDKWLDMNMESDLTPKEMTYLSMCSNSDISIRQYESEDGCINLEWEMEPNEIRYIHIYQK